MNKSARARLPGGLLGVLAKILFKVVILNILFTSSSVFWKSF